MTRDEVRVVLEELEKMHPQYTKWETDFLHSMRDIADTYGFAPSSKQAEALNKIYRKYSERKYS